MAYRKKNPSSTGQMLIVFSRFDTEMFFGEVQRVTQRPLKYRILEFCGMLNRTVAVSSAGQKSSITSACDRIVNVAQFYLRVADCCQQQGVHAAAHATIADNH
jgi:hypothetical protein